jgi:uncharacterized protein DUF4331
MHSRLLQLLVLAGVIAAGTIALSAADHRDGPIFCCSGLPVRTDLNDIYVFKSQPQSPTTTIVMTMNPMAGLVESTTFLSNAKYELLVDTDGDAAPNTTFRITFGQQTRAGSQDLTLTSESGGLRVRGLVGERVPLAGGGALLAGVFDDPFFFDTIAFREGMNFCSGNSGINFFRGLNTNAIVLELPDSILGGSRIGVWSRIVWNGGQVDRMAHPSVNAVLIPEERRGEYNSADPIGDTSFRFDLIATLRTLGNDAGMAEAIADGLLPDILRFDGSNPDGFPNGRRLTDDVIDHELGAWTNGRVTTDCVSSDSAFSASFPYLAPANK